MISSNPCLRDVFSVHVGKGIVEFGKDIEINLENLSSKTACLPKGTIVANFSEINDDDFGLLNFEINEPETGKNGKTSGMNDETFLTEPDAVTKGKSPEGLDLNDTALDKQQKEKLVKFLICKRDLFVKT